MDDELHKADVVSLIRQLLLMAPDAGVLAMVSVETMAIASRAVMAGARGFVARPLNWRDLVSTIEMVTTEHPNARDGVQRQAEGHTIAFCAPRAALAAPQWR